MECNEIRELILESLAERAPAEQNFRIYSHTASCPGCAGFLELHRELDARLAAGLPAAHPSAALQGSLVRSIRRDPSLQWPEYLPDVAHLSGCAAAIAALLFVLPWRPETVILAGAAFSIATYMVQAVLRSSFE